MSAAENRVNPWVTICAVGDLIADAGICALVAGAQVAVFHESIGDNLYALGNYDPIGKAHVMSRGIIGSFQGRPVVASPLYKQHFDLITGECLEQPQVRLPVYEIRIDNDAVQVRRA